MKGLFIGLTVVDILYSLPGYPEENSKNMSRRHLLDIGGPATNAACTFSALGGEATLISGIGNHSLTGFIEEGFNSFSIQHFDLFGNQKTEPVVASVLVNQTNGSRTVTSTNANLLPTIILPLEEVILSDYDIICLDGFYADFVLDLLSGNQNRIPVVFDGGSWKPGTEAMLSHVTYPIFSSHFQPPEVQGLIAFMATKNHFPYAITHGEKPLEIITKHGSESMETPPVKAIDTLGAGDIFHGAFSYFIKKTEGNFKAALAMSAEIASRSCQYFGAKTWIEHHRS
jgi:sugar/nucleoside kinase (ribokinase family)